MRKYAFSDNFMDTMGSVMVANALSNSMRGNNFNGMVGQFNRDDSPIYDYETDKYSNTLIPHVLSSIGGGALGALGGGMVGYRLNAPDAYARTDNTLGGGVVGGALGLAIGGGLGYAIPRLLYNKRRTGKYIPGSVDKIIAGKMIRQEAEARKKELEKQVQKAMRGKTSMSRKSAYYNYALRKLAESKGQGKERTSEEHVNDMLRNGSRLAGLGLAVPGGILGGLGGGLIGALGSDRETRLRNALIGMGVGGVGGAGLGYGTGRIGGSLLSAMLNDGASAADIALNGQ